MVTNSFNNSTNQFGLSRFQSYIKEDSARVCIFKRAAVAMEPRGENDTAGTCRRFGNDFDI